jgi:hypothetical protein
MRPYVYDFSILEPVASNSEFAEKVKEAIYPTLGSIFSLKRLLTTYYIAQFCDRGEFQNTGRYRLRIVIRGTKVHATLIRFV